MDICSLVQSQPCVSASFSAPVSAALEDARRRPRMQVSASRRTDNSSRRTSTSARRRRPPCLAGEACVSLPRRRIVCRSHLDRRSLLIPPPPPRAETRAPRVAPSPSCLVETVSARRRPGQPSAARAPDWWSAVEFVLLWASQ
ncbi:hypothetical protein M6B38_316650 [Iris pallida]|uniref:Uncharacterized protein n=1 Tax=Iris pallida TaxID=29817 RepID=A0AAX6HDM4_IRIPA|nr:hypothetical protein M6B38_316645 [Iris pallida]KAJ6839129.1 hypothetical protein M6B38_316650 [Iris pallida]